MPQITSIEPQKKHQGRFNIYIDGQFAFGADEDLVVNHRLVVGKSLLKEDLDKLLFEAEVGKLMDRMYNLFSIRQRSEREVRNYFKIKNLKSTLRLRSGREIKGGGVISGMVVDLVVEKLKEKGLVNDRHFAEAWVEGRRRSKQKGIQALKSELYQKGIDREIIEEVISEPFGSAQVRSDRTQGEEELARKALEKKLNTWKNLNPQEFKQKAYQYLARKGFEYSVIARVLDKYQDNP